MPEEVLQIRTENFWFIDLDFVSGYLIVTFYHNGIYYSVVGLDGRLVCRRTNVLIGDALIEHTWLVENLHEVVDDLV